MSPDVPAQPKIEVTRASAFAVALALALLGIIAYLFLSRANLGAWDFRNNLWGPAHLLVNGDSPYAIESLFPGSKAVWMPTVIGAFFPLGYLTERDATAVWAILVVVAYGAMLVLSLGVERPTPLLLGICVGLLLIFPPFVSAFQLGQYGTLAALLLLLAGRLAFRGTSPVWIGLLLALASAKPQLLLLPVSGLLLYLWRTRGIRSALAVLAASGVWALLLTLPLWIATPDWIGGFLEAQAQRGMWSQPSAFVLLPLHLGDVGVALWALLTLAVITLNLWQWRRLPPHHAFVWSMALNVVITPYVWSWDFVLLAPLFVSTFFALKLRLPRIVLLIGYSAIWYAMVSQRLTTSNDDSLYWWVPWVMIALIAVVQMLSRRASQPGR